MDRIFYSWFLAPIFSVRQNAVKNVLFNIAALLLKLTVFKVFAYIAFRLKAYMPYLMFAEDPVQKFFFVVSRRFNSHAILVLAFAIAFAGAGLYDTVLWALDDPGYITRSSTVGAETVVSHLLSDPTYVVFMNNPEQNVTKIDIDETVSGNLFKAGFNFTLPGSPPPNTGEIVASTLPFNETGPRIWLDDEGFSVSVDQATMILPPDFLCPMTTLDNNRQVWKCIANNTDALGLLSMQAGPLGIPEIFWDLENSEYLLPSRRDNPWYSFGTGGNTGMMKQVFTVTKGRRRHTFLETALKISMVAMNPAHLDEGEITDMVRRTWATDPSQPIDSVTQTLANIIIAAQANGTSYTMGELNREDYSVSSASLELLNPVDANLQPYYALFRSSAVNISLIRSETLPEPVTSFTSCPYYFSTLATGGVVRTSTCYKSDGNATDAHFLGQLDTSSMIIISDILGDGTSSTSATALNQTGIDWYQKNQQHIEQLLISRSFIVGGNSTLVPISVKHNEAALSYLQIMLISLPGLLCLASFIIMIRDRAGYYKSSFLAAVCTTTHVSGGSCEDVSYLYTPPNIKLDNRGDHVLLGTPGRGHIANVADDQVIAYALSAEPLLDHPWEESKEWTSY